LKSCDRGVITRSWLFAPLFDFSSARSSVAAVPCAENLAAANVDGGSWRMLRRRRKDGERLTELAVAEENRDDVREGSLRHTTIFQGSLALLGLCRS
jgi:hypothetical protein